MILSFHRDGYYLITNFQIDRSINQRAKSFTIRRRDIRPIGTSFQKRDDLPSIRIRTAKALI